MGREGKSEGACGSVGAVMQETKYQYRKGTAVKKMELGSGRIESAGRDYCLDFIP